MSNSMSFVDCLFLLPDGALAVVYANCRRKESWCYENGYGEEATKWDVLADAVMAEAGFRSRELQQKTLTKALRLKYGGPILH